MIQAKCNFAWNENWTAISVAQGSSSVYKLVGKVTGQCMEVASASKTSGAVVDQNTCNGGANQLWTFAPAGPSFKIVNQNSSMCVNVDGSNLNAGGDPLDDNASITQKPCSSAANFLWTFSSGLFTSSSLIVAQAAHSGQCLNVYGGSTQVGGGIIQWPCAGSANEQWTLLPTGGLYQVVATNSGLCLSNNGTVAQGANLMQATCSTANTGGLWSLSAVNSSYQLISANSGLCMDVYGAGQGAGTGVIQWQCSGALNQSWSLSNATLPSAWSAVTTLPLVPAAVANLPNGQLLTWSAYQPDYYENDIGSASGQTYTSVFDPVSGSASSVVVTSTGDDMFCPGTTNLSDGRILVNGGSSSPKTSIYNPATSGWVSDAVMNIPRGYEGNTLLSNGTVLTFGGSWSGPAAVRMGEVWSKGAGWSVLSGLPTTNVLGTDTDATKDDDHLWLFAQSNGRVFHAGPSSQMNWITTTGTGSITSAGNRSDDPYSQNGKAMMYDVGMIMKTGGAQAYNKVAAEASTYVININNGVTVNKVAPMAYPRTFANGVVLPNGQIVISGGQTSALQWSDSNSVLIPEIWDPATLVFRQLAPMQVPRNYHSSSILMQDGRVFSGGGGLCYFDCGVDHLNAEILTPPYLLNADGTAATRPVISSAPATAALGSTVTVKTSAPVVSFVLMRLSSATHSVNNDQRRIPVLLASTSGNSYSLSIPSDPGTVLPGYYWIFAFNAQGVPSVGSTVLIN